jgi:integrase/recombinase XerC
VSVEPYKSVEWGGPENGPAPLTRPDPGIEGISSDAEATLLSPETLAFAARVREGAVKDKTYRATPIGEEVGRYMRETRWSGTSDNTLLAVETVLSRLALDFAHFKTLTEFTNDHLVAFLDEHWGSSSAATRAQRLAIVRSFFSWAVEHHKIAANPARTIKRPRIRNQERHAYRPDVIHTLVRTQDSLRDQIALQMLGRLGLRRNELRLLRLRDIDLAAGTVLVHGKGNKQAVIPIGSRQLRKDLELYLIGRNLGEYLLHPKARTHEPMTGSAVHNWFKACLAKAGLPASIKMHELRHSAADNLFRSTGNLLLAQTLLRHESVATTQVYLHPNRDDLAMALEALDDDGEYGG